MINETIEDTSKKFGEPMEAVVGSKIRKEKKGYENQSKNKHFQKIDVDIKSDEVLHEVKGDYKAYLTGNLPFEFFTHVSYAEKEKLDALLKPFMSYSDCVKLYQQYNLSKGCNYKTQADYLEYLNLKCDSDTNEDVEMAHFVLPPENEYPKVAPFVIIDNHKLIAYLKGEYTNGIEPRFPVRQKWQKKDKGYNFLLLVPYKELYKRSIAETYYYEEYEDYLSQWRSGKEIINHFNELY